MPQLRRVREGVQIQPAVTVSVERHSLTRDARYLVCRSRPNQGRQDDGHQAVPALADLLLGAVRFGRL